jgi:hypothetical protein
MYKQCPFCKSANLVCGYGNYGGATRGRYQYCTEDGCHFFEKWPDVQINLEIRPSEESGRDSVQ